MVKKFQNTRELNHKFVSLSAPAHRMISFILAGVHLHPHSGDTQ